MEGRPSDGSLDSASIPAGLVVELQSKKMTYIGTWTAEEENQIRVSFEAEQQESYTMQVLSCDESLLKIQIRSDL